MKDAIAAEESSSSGILVSLQLSLLEHSVMCHLITGSKAQAIKEIAKICGVLSDQVLCGSFARRV